MRRARFSWRVIFGLGWVGVKVRANEGFVVEVYCRPRVSSVI